MPMVGGEKFPYTAKGEKAAKKKKEKMAAKKKSSKSKKLAPKKMIGKYGQIGKA